MALLLIAVPLALNTQNSYALSLYNKTLVVGTSEPSSVTTHNFSYNAPSSASIGSVEYEYCTNSPFPGTACTVPAGIDVTSAVIASQSGITGFSVHGNTTNNRLVITRPASVVGPAFVQHNFSNITNPSDTETSVYVRISTFATTDGTGARTDEGGLVFSTSGGFAAVGFVPPYMTFCVGISVALNCSSATGFFIDIGQLSTSQTRTANTQFAVATNDPEGYNIFTLGTTMTSGTNIITPMASAQTSSPGASQFGINLRDNSAPDIGQDIAGGGSGGPAVGYGSPDLFRFVSGGLIASTIDSTDFNRYTVSYVVNINDAQPSGRYSTTITYLALASF